MQLQFCRFWGVKISCFESMNVASLGHVKDMPHLYNSVLTGMQPSKHEHTHWTCFYYVRNFFCMCAAFFAGVLQVFCRYFLQLAGRQSSNPNPSAPFQPGQGATRATLHPLSRLLSLCVAQFLSQSPPDAWTGGHQGHSTPPVQALLPTSPRT